MPETIRAFMRWTGHTTAQVAPLIGVVPSGLSDRLHGKTSFRAEELAVLAALFDVDVNDFYRSSDEILAGRGTGNQLMEGRLARMQARLSTLETAMYGENQGDVEPSPVPPDPPASRGRRAAATSQGSAAQSGGASPKAAKAAAAKTSKRRPS